MTTNTIKIGVDAPITAPGVTHTGTSWQASADMHMDTSNLIVNIENSDTHLLDYTFTYDMSNHDIVYVRSKYHFSDGSESVWSKIVPIHVDQKGLKISSTLVVTPQVTVNYDYTNNNLGELVIRSSDMRLYGGAGSHSMTSYRILDTGGNEVFVRNNDTSNLTELRLPLTVLEFGKAYSVEVRHHTTTNAHSNYGRAMLITPTKGSRLFNITTRSKLVPNAWMYFNVDISATNYTSVDIRIIDSLNNEVVSAPSQTVNVPKIFTGDLVVGKTYTVQARITLIDSTVTEYVDVVTTTAVDNSVIEYDPSVSYLDRFSFVETLNLNGVVTQTSYETSSGDILLMSAGSRTVNLYRVSSNKLYYRREAFDIDSTEIGSPFINFIPTLSGDLVVDYSGSSGDVTHRHPRFNTYEYNPVTSTYTLRHSIRRTDELFSTAVSTSAVSYKDGCIYYIPAIMIDSNGDRAPLALRRYDYINNAMLSDIALPFTAYGNVSLTMLPSNELLILGGTTGPTNTDDGPVIVRSNNDVYKFNPPTGDFYRVRSLPDSISINKYNLQLLPRRDGNIVIFNASFSGTTAGDQDTYEYRVSDNDIYHTSNDISDDLPYLSNIVMCDGGILRISARLQDPQKSYVYISNTMDASDIVTNDTINVITDLPDSENGTTSIIDPGMFSSITIEGGGSSDSGTGDGDQDTDGSGVSDDGAQGDQDTDGSGVSDDGAQDGSNDNSGGLVVPTNKTISITDPGKYDSITIGGSDSSDTGTLIWDKDGEDGRDIVFQWNDLIVTKEDYVGSSTAPDRKWNSITLLQDATLRL